MKKNEKEIMEIIDYSTDGFGIAKASDGMTVFVPNSAVGDKAEILILKELKKFCFGKIINLISPSKDRIEADCEVFNRCGGCCFRHINYKAEATAKQKRVADAVKRIGGVKTSVNECLQAKNTERYRNKGQYPVRKDKDGKVTAGFYSLHSHIVVPCSDCILQPKEFSAIVDTCVDFFNNNKISAYDERSGKGLVRHIYLRKSDYENSVLVCLVINGESIKNQEELVEKLKKMDFVSGVVLNINKKKGNVILGDKCKLLYGKDYIFETLLGVKLKISSLAFFQVNREMTEFLYKTVADFADVKGKTVLDLFCGAGTIGLSIAKGAKKLIGVEIVSQAVENAKENARINGIENAEFYCNTAENAAKEFDEKGIKTDVVILDPPRKGATEKLIDTICNGFSPERVVYVSCDPATLSRDLKVFETFGYKTQKVQPVDMFPRTAHVECVCLMSKTR